MSLSLGKGTLKKILTESVLIQAMLYVYIMLTLNGIIHVCLGTNRNRLLKSASRITLCTLYNHIKSADLLFFGDEKFFFLSFSLSFFVVKSHQGRGKNHLNPPHLCSNSSYFLFLLFLCFPYFSSFFLVLLFLNLHIKMK